MKCFIKVIGFAFLFMAGSAPVIAVGFGLYDWVNDMEFKLAVWGAFKLWLIMLAVGLAVGFPCAIFGSSK